MVDLIVVMGLISVISAITIPAMTGAIERMRLGQSARDVERELQSAKQRAVGKNRVIRVHFNCPGPRQYRAVELIGTPTVPLAADTAANRCTLAAYPYPADNNPLTRPNLDGPLRQIDARVSFGTVRSVEFRPDGRAHYNTGGTGEWPLIPTTGINLSLVRGTNTSTITVNGIGRVQLRR